MKFLTKEQFEKEAFIHYLRTGEAHYYEDYIEWIENLNFKKLKVLEEIKDFKNDFQKFKEKILTNETSEPKNNVRYVVWRSGKGRKKEKKNYSDIPTAPAVYIYAYPDEDEGGDGEKAEGEPCETCQNLNGEVFEEGSEPEKPHPNCNCTAEFLDEEGNGTGEYKDLKEFEPKEKTEIPNTPKEEIEKDHNGLISSDWGNRSDPKTGEPKMHHGQDWRGVPEGTPVVAAKEGKVVESRTSDSFGNTVVIEHEDEHGNTSTTRYAHMQEPSALSKGDVVEQGDFIGNLGNTGKSTGPHLHYERRDSFGNSFRPPAEEINFLIDYFAPFKYK